jgi:creatinine amidohydrolase/Fe(II)-dependent formamide hydrolase-like protein
MPPLASDMSMMTWPEFESAARAAPFAVLAVGSVEQHGPHLPLSADLMVARLFAELVAEQYGALLLPSPPIGVNVMFGSWPGSLGVGAAVFSDYVRQVAQSVGRWNRRLLVINGHDENQESLQSLARELAPDIDVVVLEWAHVALDKLVDISESQHERHAGELLTSLFLYRWPEAVRQDQITDSTPTGENYTADDLHTPMRAFRPIRIPYTGGETGVYGQPSLATAEKGKAIVAAVAQRIEDLVNEIGWEANTND